MCDIFLRVTSRAQVARLPLDKRGGDVMDRKDWINLILNILQTVVALLTYLNS